jgi:hypothetical protein
MKKVNVILLAFLLFSSMGFADSGPSEESTQSKVNQAKDAKEEAEAAIYGNETDYSIYFERCPDVLDDWNDALDKLGIAGDLYDSAFEDYILGNYNDSYNDAQKSIEASNDAIELIEGIPQKIYYCQARERREAASYAISLATKAKNDASDIVAEKLACPDVEANWTKGNEKLTLANTHFTGGSYNDAKDAADLAREYFEAAEAAAGECVPPVVAEEPEIECEVDAHCEDDEICDLGQCIPVHCECGYVSNHICHEYECCEDADCPSGQVCISHSCTVEQEPQPPTVSVPPEQPSEEEAVDYACPFPAVSLLALLGIVISREL